MKTFIDRPWVKVVCSILVISFIALDIAWAHPQDDIGRASGPQAATLAAPYVTQGEPVNDFAAKLRQSVLAERSLVLAIFDIAEFLLGDETHRIGAMPIDHLEGAIQTELDKCRAGYGVDLSRVTFREGVITVNYTDVSGKAATIAIAAKDNLAIRDLAGYDWALSEKYAVKVLGIDAAIVPASVPAIDEAAPQVQDQSVELSEPVMEVTKLATPEKKITIRAIIVKALILAFTTFFVSSTAFAGEPIVPISWHATLYGMASGFVGAHPYISCALVGTMIFAWISGLLWRQETASTVFDDGPSFGSTFYLSATFMAILNFGLVYPGVALDFSLVGVAAFLAVALFSVIASYILSSVEVALFVVPAFYLGRGMRFLFVDQRKMAASAANARELIIAKAGVVPGEDLLRAAIGPAERALRRYGDFSVSYSPGLTDGTGHWEIMRDFQYGDESYPNGGGTNQQWVGSKVLSREKLKILPPSSRSIYIEPVPGTATRGPGMTAKGILFFLVALLASGSAFGEEAQFSAQVTDLLLSAAPAIDMLKRAFCIGAVSFGILCLVCAAVALWVVLADRAAIKDRVARAWAGDENAAKDLLASKKDLGKLFGGKLPASVLKVLGAELSLETVSGARARQLLNILRSVSALPDDLAEILRNVAFDTRRWRDVRTEAARILDVLGWKPGSEQERMEYLAILGDWRSLGQCGDAALPVLRSRIIDSNDLDRFEAVEAVAQIGTPQAIALLSEVSAQKDRVMADTVHRAILKFAPKTISPEYYETIFNSGLRIDTRMEIVKRAMEQKDPELRAMLFRQAMAARWAVGTYVVGTMPIAAFASAIGVYSVIGDKLEKAGFRGRAKYLLPDDLRLSAAQLLLDKGDFVVRYQVDATGLKKSVDRREARRQLEQIKGADVTKADDCVYLTKTFGGYKADVSMHEESYQACSDIQGATGSVTTTWYSTDIFVPVTLSIEPSENERSVGPVQDTASSENIHANEKDIKAIYSASMSALSGYKGISPEALFVLVRSKVPASMQNLRNALAKLEPLSAQESVSADAIAQAIAGAQKEFTLSDDEAQILRLALLGPGQGRGEAAEEKRLDGVVLAFDVDETLLEKDETLDSRPELREMLVNLLKQGARIVIISGNSKAMQVKRVADPLAAALKGSPELLQNFFMYTSGGGIFIHYDEKGMAIEEKLSTIDEKDIDAIRAAVEDELPAIAQSLTPEERAVMEKWYLKGSQKDYPGCTFDASWMTGANVTVPVLSDVEVEGIKAAKGALPGVWLETRDGASLTIKPLPDAQTLSKDDALKSARSHVMAALEAKLGELIARRERSSVATPLIMGVGGSTSIDITQRGIDKRFALERLIGTYLKGLGFTPRAMAYFGDEFKPGGNDFVMVGIKDLIVFSLMKKPEQMAAEAAEQAFQIGRNVTATLDFLKVLSIVPDDLIEMLGCLKADSVSELAAKIRTFPREVLEVLCMIEIERVARLHEGKMSLINKLRHGIDRKFADIVDELAGLGEAAVPDLTGIAKDRALNDWPRSIAILALGRNELENDRNVVPALLEIVQEIGVDGSLERIRLLEAVSETFGKLGPAAFNKLAEMVHDENVPAESRIAAAEVIRRMEFYHSAYHFATRPLGQFSAEQEEKAKALIASIENLNTPGAMDEEDHNADLEQWDDIQTGRMRRLVEIGPPTEAVVSLLLKMLAVGASSAVRQEAARGLVAVGPVTPQVVPHLLKALEQPYTELHWTYRQAIAAIMKQEGGDAFLPLLVRAMGSEFYSVHTCARGILAEVKGEDFANSLLVLTYLAGLNDADRYLVRREAAIRLEKAGLFTTDLQVRKYMRDLQDAKMETAAKIEAIKALGLLGPRALAASQLLYKLSFSPVFGSVAREALEMVDPFGGDGVKSFPAGRDHNSTFRPWGYPGLGGIIAVMSAVLTASSGAWADAFVFDRATLDLYSGIGVAIKEAGSFIIADPAAAISIGLSVVAIGISLAAIAWVRHEAQARTVKAQEMSVEPVESTASRDAKAKESLLEVIRDYIEELNDVNETVQARFGLIRIGAPAVPLLIDALKDDRRVVKLRAVEVLGNIRDSRAIQPLVDMAGKEGATDEDLRRVLIGALTAFLNTGEAALAKEALEALDRKNVQAVDIVPAAPAPLNNIAAQMADEANRLGAYLMEHDQIPNVDPVNRTKATAEMKYRIAKIADSAGKLRSEEHVATAARLRGDLDRLEAEGIVSSLIALARQAKKDGQKLIIGLETGWMPGYGRKGSFQHDAMNPLMKEILRAADTLRSMGLDNVEIIDDKDAALAEKLLDRAEKTHTKLTNVVVIASQESINSRAFKRLKSTAGEQRAFLAAIDPTELRKAARDIIPGGDKTLDVEIMEIISIALDLAVGKEPPQIPMVLSYDRALRIIVLLPKARIIDYEVLKDLNSARIAALVAA